ncbi:hypothetical protein [Cystobacter fuscus]|uniref:hypothetical protein n=1 Tax=Cystobacter fuscus TaxID=43 RepID=UPI0012DFE4D6|nr:hypothetical protein [Cystobacter fuscus]
MKLLAPWVRLCPGWTPQKGTRVDVSLKLGSGTFTYPGEQKPVEVVVKDWVVTFTSQLAISDLAQRIQKAGGQVPPELKAQLEVLGERYLDYRCLYLDLENVNLLDEESVLISGPRLPKEAQAAMREHLRRWIELRRDNLDATLLCVMPARPKPGLEPTVHPTGVTFATHEQPIPQRREPVRVLSWLMTTQGRPVPTHDVPAPFQKPWPVGSQVDGVLVLGREAALNAFLNQLKPAFSIRTDAQLSHTGESLVFACTPTVTASSLEGHPIFGGKYTLCLRQDRRSFDFSWTKVASLRVSQDIGGKEPYVLTCEVRSDYTGVVRFETPPQNARSWRAVADKRTFQISGTNWNGQPFDPRHIDEKGWIEMLLSLRYLPKLAEKIAATRAQIENLARFMADSMETSSVTSFAPFEFVPPGNANFSFSNLRFDDQLNLLVEVMFDYTVERPSNLEGQRS